MIKSIGSVIIITSTTGLLIYYVYYRKNTPLLHKKDKIILCDAETQTHEATTPPNEINQPDFINVERIIENEPRRSMSLTNFVNYMRNI
jgi:hypothetical protein